jgi:hypothetical protein
MAIRRHGRLLLIAASYLGGTCLAAPWQPALPPSLSAQSALSATGASHLRKPSLARAEGNDKEDSKPAARDRQEMCRACMRQKAVDVQPLLLCILHLRLRVSRASDPFPLRLCPRLPQAFHLSSIIAPAAPS